MICADVDRPVERRDRLLGAAAFDQELGMEMMIIGGARAGAPGGLAGERDGGSPVPPAARDQRPYQQQPRIVGRLGLGGRTFGGGAFRLVHGGDGGAQLAHGADDGGRQCGSPGAG
jgi:hypothetical protein